MQWKDRERPQGIEVESFMSYSHCMHASVSACFYLLGLPTTEDSVVMSECVHAVKLRDISKGKRIMRRASWLSFFCFGKVGSIPLWSTLAILRGTYIYTCCDVLHLHASTIGTLLYTIIACMNINAMESVFSSQTDTLFCAIHLCLPGPTFHSYNICQVSLPFNVQSQTHNTNFFFHFHYSPHN